MNSLIYNNHTYHLNQSIQTDLDESRFKYVGLQKDLTKGATWRKVNGYNIEFYHWIYTFRYTDKQGGFTLLLDCYDKVSFGGVI